VDLTASIRNILRNYPEGTAVLKELVQVHVLVPFYSPSDLGQQRSPLDGQIVDCGDTVQHGSDSVVHCPSTSSP